MYRSIVIGMFAGLFAGVPAPCTSAQGASVVTGEVTLEANGEPVHGAVVLIVGLGSFTTTDHEGRYRIERVPEGTYQLLVQREHLSAERQPITVAAEETVEANIKLALSPVHEHVTVTTSARGATTGRESFNAVTTLDSFELAQNMWGTLGEVLENEPGVAKRSFGRRCCTALAESKCAYGGGRGMFDHEVSQAQPVQAREAEGCFRY